MRLSELELFGFKSFPKKTRVSFEQGITSIVGPNGCGKSNIVDAIRWALGEQSAKSLRGDKMDSVIFSGGSNKNPASLAEVSLIVENGQHSEAGNGNKTEKTKVTRRLYRNGDSEYLLNGVPCLLRDVTELFADTGIGASAYSVMEQAMVEALISDRTENRREIMDEAAGITKYKFRRRLTARKLENTEADLVRISDLVSEVRKQVGSLKRQMRKAEGYQKLKQELKEVELKVSRKQLTDIKQKLESLEISLKEQSDSAISGDTELSKLDVELEKLKLAHLEIEKAIGKVRSELDQLGQNIFQKQEGISIARQKSEHLQGNLTRLQNEITLDAERLESFQETVASRKSESEEVKLRLEFSISENQKHQSEVKKMQSKVDSSRLVLEETAKLQTQIVIEEEQKKNLLANLSEFIQKHNSRESELLGSFDEDRARLDKTKMDLSSAQREKLAEDEQLQKLQTRKESLLNEIRAAEKSVAELQAEVGQVQSRLASENSRREVLKQLWESYEGFQNGVQALIAQRQQYDIVDTVANLLKTEKAYRIAVEAALGEKAHYLVGKDKQQVFRAMELLKQKDWGEAGFILSEQKGKSTGSESAQNLNLPKGLVPLSSLVSTRDGKDGFISLLFSKIYLAESSKMAMEVLSEVPSDIVLVTPQGELYSSLGIFRGGARKEAELVGREEQVQEAFRTIQKTEKELQEHTDRLAAQTKRLEASKTELEQLYAQIESASSLLREREIRIAELNSGCQQLDLNLKNLLSEKDKNQSQYVESQNKIELLETEILQQKSRLREIEEKQLEQKEIVRAEENLLRESQQQLNQKMFEQATLDGERKRLEEDEFRLQNDIVQARQRIETARDSVRQTGIEIESTGATITSDLAAMETLKNEKIALSDALSELDSQQFAFLEHINQKESQAKQVRKAQSELGHQVHQLELNRQELDSQLRQLKDKIWEEYEVDLHQVPNPQPEEIEQLDAIQQQTLELKTKLKDYGMVNLLAIEEYEKEKERLDFMENQMQDLISAKEDLLSTITEINNQARELFFETFEKVKANFKIILAEVFDGGEADLLLEEGVDPLEAQIEIMAQPRGKKLITLSQLSGGEKALVAISLLFSVYLVKPSPFCILDEVDAPLDDSNVGRYIKLLRKFADQTQFIIITHNKLSMEAADSLYGITMATPGESEIVSVKFNQIQSAN